MSEGISMVHPKAVWGAALRLAAVAVLAGASASCGQLTREGQASSYLILTTLQGAPGGNPGSLGTTLASDVLTVVNSVPTVFEDIGQASLQLALKDPGTTAAPNTPSVNNAITIDRYHVAYIRSDGRNTPGVDVPFAFDGAVTTTISGSGSVGFTLVRLQAKEEAPLAALRFNGGAQVITTIAQVTFYGHDQTGREVSVTGNIQVSFSDWGD